MKKISLLLAFLGFIGLQVVFAQTRDLSGVVTSSEDGSSIPGASVIVKGTTVGTVTDTDGKFTLKVPNNAKVLFISFVGLASEEVAITSSNSYKVVLKPEAIAVGEVVVTGGYGIKRAPKGSTALNQVVNNDKLTAVRQTNVNNALAGKVSGIQFQGQSAAALGRTGNIRLRGDGGFSTGNGVLYVVDGTILPNSNDINMDDVEDVNVLSGPSASAILGAQGANGAIIITTKKGKSSANNGKVNIELNTGVLASNVYIVPNYQNDYAGGNTNTMTRYTYKPTDPVEWKTLDGKYYPNYSDDSSWGPRMVGQEYIPWYSWYAGTKYTGTTAKLVPQPNNARNFFDTGTTYNNSVAFSKSTEDFNIRVSLGNVAVKGLLPTTSLNKTSFGLKTSYKVAKGLTFAANVNFYTTQTNGDFNDAYSNQSSGSFNQWFHRDLDMGIMKELQGLRTSDGIYASWNHNDPTAYDPNNTKPFYAANYWYNFYTYQNLTKSPSTADRLFGDISMDYQIIDCLSAKLTYRRQQNVGWGEQMFSSDLNDSGTQTTGNEPRNKGFYSTKETYSNRENLESLLTFSKVFGKFKVNANAGTDFFQSIYKYNGAQTVNGFNIKNLYSISNSKDQPFIGDPSSIAVPTPGNVTRSQEKYKAAFVRADAGYKDFVFVDFTLRNDWYSSLPPANNSIMSKSFGASFVFSDLLKLPWLSFGKIRGAWGEVPTPISVFTYPGFAYGVGSYQWNGNFLMTTPDQLVDPNIRGAVKTQKELGAEVRFFNNRVGLTATYWDGTEKDIPYSVSISNYSGFTSKYLNTGLISKNGVDLALNLKPITLTNFSWDFNATAAFLLKNQIDKIAEGIDQFVVQTIWSRNSVPVMVHSVGKEWGQLFGGGIKKDSISGLPLLDKSGNYVSKPDTYFGSVLPKVTGGIQNTFTVMKDFTVMVNIDYQFGGKFFSLSDMWGTYSGLTAKTSGLNDKGNPIRDAVANGGGVHVSGVDVDTRKPVDYYIAATDWAQNPYNKGYYDEFIHSLTYIKLRELSIGYKLPVAKLGWSKFVSGINVSIFAQNPWLIYAKDRDFDPSEISAASGEAGQFPGVRSVGANIKINF